MAGIAQLVEPRIVIPVVAGSIPVVHPIIPSESQHVFIFRKKRHSLTWVCIRLSLARRLTDTGISFLDPQISPSPALIRLLINL